MGISSICTEEVPFETMKIRKHPIYDQTYRFTANVSWKIDNFNPRTTLGINGRRCISNLNEFTNLSGSKKKLMEIWPLKRETSKQMVNSSSEAMKEKFSGFMQQIRPLNQTTGGTTTTVAVPSGCLSPPSAIPIKSSQAYGILMSLYDFSSPDQAFQALFGNKIHEYYCPLLDEEIDQETLMAMYKQIVAIINNQLN